MSKIYGLTGGIASGKTTVLDILSENGCKIFNADKIAREVVEVGTVGLRQIVSEFGEDILLPDGSLDRKKMSKIVFSDKTQLKRLTDITAPLIRKRILNIIENVHLLDDKTIYIFEIPLLFESNYQPYFDAVISVYVEFDIQLKRLMKRNNLDKKSAEDQINSQMSMAEKKKLADYVIDNSGDLSELQSEIKTLLKNL
ncbi:dephospho-CoA kinase [Companilactobacillus tucceti DSM 20183]|uniref:Dephospho-CoA kinase n=1 Tax=Companilactobacillus tucceti DSM 20183 TaxID=1423811 RepID=A0A0R1J2K4_9LACO|nr:dephospho-CoA kinase [Companilactobacillus tucceti]KRK65584.1 dephospho-CoA kinase [Companilactobacillus tucceti DSM 20183]